MILGYQWDTPAAQGIGIELSWLSPVRTLAHPHSLLIASGCLGQTPNLLLPARIQIYNYNYPTSHYLLISLSTMLKSSSSTSLYAQENSQNYDGYFGDGCWGKSTETASTPSRQEELNPFQEPDKRPLFKIMAALREVQKQQNELQKKTLAQFQIIQSRVDTNRFFTGVLASQCQEFSEYSILGDQQFKQIQQKLKHYNLKRACIESTAKSKNSRKPLFQSKSKTKLKPGKDSQKKILVKQRQ